MFVMRKIALSWGFLLLSSTILWIAPFHNALVVPLSTAKPKESLTGVFLPRVVLDGNNKNTDGDAEFVNLGAELGSGSTDKRTMVVFGSHAGDFNTIEYLQKIRFAYPKLTEEGNIGRIICVVNGAPDQIKLLAGFLDLDEIGPIQVELFSDPTGEAGRKFGVDRGFRPDDDSLSPFAKQFCTGFGIGPPWMTLPAVLPGYTGNPNGKRDWIEASLKQGQLAGRWPSVLELDAANDNEIIGNKFDEAPLGLGSWGRRPFELATLRLQSLIGIQIQHWSELKPVDGRCLTQLGGCTVVEADGTAIYSWLDKGLCHVADMDDLLDAICTK